MVKRNDIVCDKNETNFVPYGRVNRRIDDEHVEVLYGNCNRRIFRDEDLEVHNEYAGYWMREFSDYPVFHWMPTLRKLKQIRARRDKTIWKRNQ